MPNEIIEFVKAALRNPLEVSTVFPTTRYLANTLLDAADIGRAKSVVELGCGTGAITKHLSPRLTPSQSFLGIEIDEPMVKFLQKEYPKLRFETGLAEQLPQWAPEGSVDVVVSSLPWTVFSPTMQANTIEAILKGLRPGGSFLTYICANALVYPQAKSFLAKLNDKFSKVERSPLEWRNIPPAFVYKSTK